MVKECAEEAMAYQRQLNRDNEAEILEEFAQTMTVTTLTDEETEAFRQASASVYDTWYDKIGAEMMNAFGYTK